MGTESWLTINHLSSEIFPKSFGYTTFRQDIEPETCGGGVFTLVKDTLIAREQKHLKISSDLIWVKIEMVAAKPLYVAAYYRSKEGDSESISELRRSLEMVGQLRGIIRLLGNLNFPKFSWDDELTPSMKSGSSFPTCYKDFVTLIGDFSLVQMVTERTRGDNILDLFLTSNPKLVNDVTVSPGHNIVIADVNVKPKISKQLPRKVPLFKKANWTSFRDFIS